MPSAPDVGDNTLRIQHDEVEDECGVYEDHEPLVDVERVARQKMLHALNMDSSELPAYPRYVTYEERLRSFENWPMGMGVSPEALSDAGLFYSSQGDRTYCFQCGGLLQGWNSHDEPWTEHARWYPSCKYVSQFRGNMVINNVPDMKETIGTIRQLVSSIDINKVNPRDLKSAIETLKIIVSSVDMDKMDARNSIDQESSLENNPRDQHAASADEIESLSDDQKATACIICFKDSKNALLLPCCHIATCCNCATKLKHCCVCRKPVSYHQRVYIS